MDTLIEILKLCKLTHTRNKTQNSEDPYAYPLPQEKLQGRHPL